MALISKISRKSGIYLKCTSSREKNNSDIIPIIIFMVEKNIGKVKNGKELIHSIDEEKQRGLKTVIILNLVMYF